MNNNWNPFFALANTRHKIDEVIESKKDVEMLDLSEDALYEIQEVILASFEEQREISLVYFNNKRHVEVVGVIKKIDVNMQIVILNEIKIKFQTIMFAKYI